jgi:hypothetical protein
MRIPYLGIYNVLVAAVCATCIAFAVQAHGRAAHLGHYRQDAARLAAANATRQQRDQVAVAKVQALAARYAALTRSVQADQKTLADVIAKTRKMKRKVVTGATIVSYASSGGSTPSG